jgi:hypothetical protein
VSGKTWLPPAISAGWPHPFLKESIDQVCLYEASLKANIPARSMSVSLMTEMEDTQEIMWDYCSTFVKQGTTSSGQRRLTVCCSFFLLLHTASEVLGSQEQKVCTYEACRSELLRFCNKPDTLGVFPYARCC